MVPSVILAIDSLSRRAEVDTSKIILLDYSFGVPFVPCIVARDHRPAVAAMVFGGGDLYCLIRDNLQRYQDPVTSGFVAFLSALLLMQIEPMLYASLISPMPLVMINGTEDRQIPPRFAGMFLNRARQPEKITWLKARHMNPRNVDLTDAIIDTLNSEFDKMDILSSED